MPIQKKRTQAKRRPGKARKPDDTHPDAYFDIAVVLAATGETKTAFSFLEKALRQGFRECKWLRTDDSFKPLRKDKRWGVILKKCKANTDAYLKSVNARLYRMNKKGEEESRSDHIDRKTLQKHNLSRCRQVRNMLEAGEVKKADDFYHAASILYAGSESSDHKLSHELAFKAVELDPEHKSAMVVAAYAKDKYLLSIGKPQIYGTQLDMVKRKLVLKKPFNLSAVTAREREKWCGSFLCKLIKSARKDTKSQRRKSPKSRIQKSRRSRG